MFNTKKTIAKKIKIKTEEKIEVELEDGSLAIADPLFVSKVEEGDRLLVNTTAVDLGLGTGGYHYVICNLDKAAHKGGDAAHIMKLRYTPLQFSTLSVDSQESKHHATLADKTSIESMPVIVGSLHSQLPAFTATAKHLNPQVKIAYIMTDGAALPLSISNLAQELKEKGLIDATITCGQAYGGDYDAVNIYSGLTCAKYVAKAQLVFVSMGPGVVGTDSILGTTALEVGQTVNAIESLKGRSIVIPRMSFKDKRARHQGISHHTITALNKVALTKTIVVLPELEKKKRNYVQKQLQVAGIDKEHDVLSIKNDVTEKALKSFGLEPTTMGRGFDEEPEFFLACGCAAIKALQYCK